MASTIARREPGPGWSGAEQIASSRQPRIRVLLADDHPVVLAGARWLIMADPGLEVIEEANTAGQAMDLAVALRPGVVVLDVSLPGNGVADTTLQLSARVPECRVLILTVHDDRLHVVRLLEAGAAGYLLKRSASSELCRAIHVVAAGGVYIDPEVAGFLVDVPRAGAGRSPRAGAGPDALSEREASVLRLTARGHSNKAIARDLRIGVKTVETYKARAVGKLGIRSRVEVNQFALRQGWLNEPE